MSALALKARELCVRRSSGDGSFELRVDDLELSPGSVLAVIGPNGAGKSTLLRALAGLEALDGGHIERGAEGPVTLVFQRPIAFAGSVLHNVRVALLGKGLGRAEVERRIHEALERVGIARLAGRRASTLSGGELRRLALARAFVLRPAVLLLDEPFDDLDAVAQESLSLDLRRAIRDTGVAVAVVAHDLRRALLLSDRIAVLQGGRVAQQGTRDEVLERPRSREVARIVGMSNLVAGTVAGAGDACFVEVVAGQRIPVSTALDAGTPVWAGIRPEHLGVDAGGGEDEQIGKAIVRSVVSDGALSTLSVEWAGLELRAHLLAGRGVARTLAAGDPVLLSVRPDEVHLIPRQP